MLSAAVLLDDTSWNISGGEGLLSWLSGLIIIDEKDEAE